MDDFTTFEQQCPTLKLLARLPPAAQQAEATRLLRKALQDPNSKSYYYQSLLWQVCIGDGTKSDALSQFPGDQHPRILANNRRGRERRAHVEWYARKIRNRLGRELFELVGEDCRPDRVSINMLQQLLKIVMAGYTFEQIAPVLEDSMLERISRRRPGTKFNNRLHLPDVVKTHGELRRIYPGEWVVVVVC